MLHNMMTAYRFIPAGAGNTVTHRRFRLYPTVYPRWRGEHRDVVSEQDNSLGLSPLARGTHEIMAGEEEPRRFIPAGAGNTKKKMNNKQKISVYPRWRGEHTAGVRNTSAAAGLSPLARGTL